MINLGKFNYDVIQNTKSFLIDNLSEGINNLDDFII